MMQPRESSGLVRAANVIARQGREHFPDGTIDDVVDAVLARGVDFFGSGVRLRRSSSTPKLQAELARLHDELSDALASVKFNDESVRERSLRSRELLPRFLDGGGDPVFEIRRMQVDALLSGCKFSIVGILRRRLHRLAQKGFRVYAFIQW